MEPIIKFEGYTLNKLNYIRIEDIDEFGKNEESEESKENFKREVTIGVTENKKNAIVVLNVAIKDFENERIVECEVIGEFTISSELEMNKIENVLSVNGVALVYPYVRSIISMITTFDSDKAIVIPTINTKIFDQNSSNEKN